MLSKNNKNVYILNLILKLNICSTVLKEIKNVYARLFVSVYVCFCMLRARVRVFE